MSVAASRTDPGTGLIALLEEARDVADALLGDAIIAIREHVCADGQSDARLMAREQRATHGLAWFATYAQALRQLASYADRMARGGRLGEVETLLVRIGAGECLAQMAGGIPMSQGELVRPSDLGLDAYTVAARIGPAIGELVATGNTVENRARLIALLTDELGATAGDCGLDDTLDAMRRQTRRFADAEVVPHAHHWHLANSYIPLETIARMADLGVFALTIPEEFDGLGLGKESMCVVTEELSRGYIGVGSIGTRRSRSSDGCPASPQAPYCRPRSSPNPTPGRTSRRCAPARCATATSTRSPATRRGSPTRSAPT
jgi:(2S)-methylsuccinyl-CoA dehydrogenase